MPQRTNPLEDLTHRLSADYKEMVKRLTQHFAPASPWWHPKLSADEQVWRWMQVREEILGWLATAGAHMGWKDAEESMQKMAEIFTTEVAVDLIPADVVIMIPIELLEMVKNQGADGTAAYIRKVEKMAEHRLQALDMLNTNRTTNFPEPPFQPPALPTEVMPGTGGWPTYGNAPRDSQEMSAFGGGG